MSFGTMRIALYLSIAILGGCGDRSPDPQLLATDVHVTVAQNSFVLPFVALDTHALGERSFLLNRVASCSRTAEKQTAFLRESADHRNPLPLDLVSVKIDQYGATDFDSSAGKVCPQLSRQWARSVCSGSQDVINRALPRSFKLVDIGRLQLDGPGGPTNCRRDRARRTLPTTVGGPAVLVCPAHVYGGDEDEFHKAVVRISGDLGALWTVWRNDSSGESAEEMAIREGKAITLFVEAALGEREDYPNLIADMHVLQRPLP